MNKRKKNDKGKKGQSDNRVNIKRVYKRIVEDEMKVVYFHSRRKKEEKEMRKWRSNGEKWVRMRENISRSRRGAE